MYIGSANLHTATASQQNHYTSQHDARLNMINGQLRTNKVHNERVIAAMNHLPREVFLPVSMQQHAYLDEDILLEDGQFLMEPMVFARLLESANIQPNDTVLLVGINTGYEAAIISYLTPNSFAVEPDNIVRQSAIKNLEQLSLNVSILENKFEEGSLEKSPFDVILFNGAVTTLPNTYKKQLKDNGKIIVVERVSPVLNGVAVLYENIKSTIGKRELFDANCPYLPGMTPESDQFRF